jgi:hypothetical protein
MAVYRSVKRKRQKETREVRLQLMLRHRPEIHFPSFQLREHCKYYQRSTIISNYRYQLDLQLEPIALYVAFKRALFADPISGPPQTFQND